MTSLKLFPNFWPSARPEDTPIAPTPGFITAVVAGGVISYFGYRSVQTYLNRRRLYGLITEKTRQRQNQIHDLHDRLRTGGKLGENKRQEIVNLSFDELRSRLQNGKLTAVEALEAFQWRALKAQEETNCVCEFLTKEAIDRATKLDKEYSGKSASSKPPLFGIPVSVKECNRLIGHDATVGFAQFIGRASEEDAALVTVLKKLGAVPFVTTNLPQSMLSIGSSNPVYGVTTNPHDKTRSPGGSSSGEGALIALRGSPLGLGTDVGGSVRVPAHWCGVCSLKPSIGRLAQAGRMGVVPGQPVIKGTAGPMGPDVDSLVWFMRAVCDDRMYALDPYVVPRPFNEQLYVGDGHPMTIGYYTYDGWLEASQACSRSVHVARQVLESKGHKLVEIVLPFDRDEIHRLVAAYVAMLVPDGGKNVRSVCARDIVDPWHGYLMNMLSQPNWLRRIRSRFTCGSKRTATIVGAFSSNVAEQTAAFSTIALYRQRFMKFWQKNNLDALICPVTASPALPVHQPSQLFTVLWWGCALYNALDFSAGVVPCTVVTEQDDQAVELMAKSDWIDRLIRTKGATGLPVGVQCVALPYREEVCLRVMKEVESGVKESGLLSKSGSSTLRSI